MLTELIELPGGSFRMGSTSFYPEEAPIHTATVGPFAIERHPVTNAQFAKFVAATGYKTIAEIAPTKEEFPTAPPENLVAGSTVFTPTAEPVKLDNMFQWWRYEQGADWKHPEGAKSGIEGKGDYPVVQIAYADAVAYAKWADKRLPTEAEWEFAARGGLDGATYAWGDEFMPGGRNMAGSTRSTSSCGDPQAARSP